MKFNLGHTRIFVTIAHFVNGPPSSLMLQMNCERSNNLSDVFVSERCDNIEFNFSIDVMAIDLIVETS